MQQYEGDNGKYPKIPVISEPPSFISATTSAPPPPPPTAIPNVYVDPGRYDTMTSFTQISQPSHSQQPTTIIHYATPAILSTAPRTEPVLVNCPKCFKLVTTKPEPVTGLVTWISCIAFCFISCCCVPFFTKSLRDVRHRCPACSHIIARYERL